VVLPDLRGTGETKTGNARGRDSNDTNLSVHLQLFGETLLGERLRDLRSLLEVLRKRSDADSNRILLWGDSFSPPNTAETNFQVPHGVEKWPTQAGPMGGLVAMLGVLFEDDILAVYSAGGLKSYQDVLAHYAVLIPHDVAVPGVLTAGDISDLATSLSPKPLCIEADVNHLNQPVSQAEISKTYATTMEAYSAAPRSLHLSADRTSAADRFLNHLRKP
jgi:hypothetical protein